MARRDRFNALSLPALPRCAPQLATSAPCSATCSTLWLEHYVAALRSTLPTLHTAPLQGFRPSAFGAVAPHGAAPTSPISSSHSCSCGWATLGDTSSSLLSIGPDITRQTMTSRTTICRALLFHSINCKPSRETGGCTHACPSRPSCNHTHTRAARQCRPTITTRSNMRITRPCVSAFELFF